MARKDKIRWNGAPLALDRPLLQRLKEPESGLGSGWATWFYSNHPDWFRHLPRSTRVFRARTALGPAGASWLRSRVEGQFPTLTGLSVKSAKADGAGVRLGLAGSDGSTRELAADHVIAGTGYRTDLARLSFLGSQIRSGLRTVAGTGSSVVGRDYQTSVPGLYVIGPAVAPTMGPVMRFVFGSEHAATTVARQLARHHRRPLPDGRGSRPVMTPDHGQRGADTDGFRAVPAALSGGGPGLPRWRALAARRAGEVTPVAAMPLADTLALAAAIGLTGRAGLTTALYALAVLAVLAATGLQRLRICLRVADQAGRILAAAALPLVILLLWMPAATAARLALWSAGLVFVFRRRRVRGAARRAPRRPAHRARAGGRRRDVRRAHRRADARAP